MTTSCRVVKRHVDALVDGELDSSAQIEFERHMAGCVICREHAMFAQSMKRATKTALGGVKAPEHLRLRVLTALDSAPAPRVAVMPKISVVPATPAAPGRPVAPPRSDSRLARYALPAAAVAVVALGFATQTDDSQETVSLQAAAMPVFEDVVRRHEREHPPEVSGSPQQMTSWFQRKLEFPARPVDFGRSDAQLLGARLSNVRERDAAAFYYVVHGHRVTVMVFEPPPETFRGADHVRVHGHDLYYRTVHGYTVPMMQMGGLTYAFTGDFDRDQMIRLAASAQVGH